MDRTASCPSCHRGVFAEDAFCSWCGSSIRARITRAGESPRNQVQETIATADRLNCESCNSPVLPGDVFCSTCGARFQIEGDRGFGDALGRIPHQVREASGGKFTLVRELGRGGMGIVFLARDEELERPVAIKVLSPSWLTDDAMVERFRREARTIARLRHESIITVYDEGRAGDLSYFVMDYIEGVSLSRVLRVHGALPIALVEAILYRVGSALDYAHRPGRGIVHRDVKPSNIMIDEDGLVVVMDFGIAKASERPSGLTSTGLVIGTPEYMSPEQCRGHSVTSESDQYSLGAVAFAMLTGAPPFTGPFYQVLMAHQTEPVPSIRELRPDCPPELAAAVERMLFKVPGERWPSCGHALRELGLRPLGHDDPVILSLGELARATVERSGLGEGPEPVSRPTPSSLRIVPRPDDLEVGDELALIATLRFDDGVEEAGGEVRWGSTDPSIVRVEPETGRLFAVGAGLARIVAVRDDLEEAIEVEVHPPRVVRVAIAPAEVELAVGESLRLDASPRSKWDEPLERGVAWSSSDPRTVAVSDEGVVTARRAGRASVLAHCGGVGSSSAVRVVEAEETRAPVARIGITDPPDPLPIRQAFQLDATPLDAAGRPVDVPVTWSVEDPERIEALGEGRFRGIRPGEVGVVAEAGGIRMRVRLRVSGTLPSAGRVGPPEPAPAPASDRRPSASRPPPSPSAAPTPTRSVPLAAAIAFPVVLGVLAVWFLLGGGPRADGGGERVGDVAVLANGAAVVGGLEVVEGDRFVLEGVARGEGGETLDVPVTWSSDDPAVASVDAGGNVTASGAGVTRLVAAAGDERTRVDLTVLGRIAAVTARRDGVGTPVRQLELEVGGTATLRATVEGRDGRELPGQDVVWRSESESVASVDAEGRVTARNPGSAVVVASAGGTVLEIPVTVRAATGSQQAGRSAQEPDPTPPAEPPPAPGTLRLIVTPWGNVFVDDRPIEGSSRFEVTLPPGLRRLRIENPNFATFDTTITIPSGGAVAISKALGGTEP